jgi:Putative auto-transporter adhesin, head GIN domain
MTGSRITTRSGMRQSQTDRKGLSIGTKPRTTTSPSSMAPIIVLAAMAAGCGLFRVTGEGPIRSERRQAGAFSRIEVSTGIGVTVRMGPTRSLEVRAQENIVPIIATNVEGDALRIRSTRSYSASEGVEVTVVTPMIAGISMSGGSQGRIEGLETERLDIDLDGGARLTVKGVASSVALDASGGSSAELANLSATTITLEVSGGSTATVQASNEVSGSASGESRVTVLGDPAVRVEVSSGAHVGHD